MFNFRIAVVQLWSQAQPIRFVLLLASGSNPDHRPPDAVLKFYQLLVPLFFVIDMSNFLSSLILNAASSKPPCIILAERDSSSACYPSLSLW
jgi:hypothetical protein